MTRDLELIKQILLKLEERESCSPEEIEIDGYEADAIAFNCILLQEAGFITGEMNDERGGGELIAAWPARITWNGFEFLDLSRNKDAWNKTKGFLKEKGASVSISLFTEVLKFYVKELLDLNLGLEHLPK